VKGASRGHQARRPILKRSHRSTSPSGRDVDHAVLDSSRVAVAVSGKHGIDTVFFAKMLKMNIQIAGAGGVDVLVQNDERPLLLIVP